MASTVTHKLSSEWTLIAAGARTVAVQFRNQGRCIIHVGEVEPAPDAAGITIATGWANQPNSFAAAGLPEEASVWARSPDASEIIVLSY